MDKSGNSNSYDELIYVSKGNDLSFNNGDYFRFYDKSFNLLNLNGSQNNNFLTNQGDNFYFMKDVRYKFQITEDFCNNIPIFSGFIWRSNIRYNCSFKINIYTVKFYFYFKS